MKVVRWLNDPTSGKSVTGLVEVEPGEIADLEEMVKLVDGDVGNFGFRMNIVATEPYNVNSIVRKDVRGWESTKSQFGFDKTSQIQKAKRLYEVTVYRD